VVSKRRAWATGPPAEPVPLDRRELHRRLRCPNCGGAFDTYPHLGPGAVVIDNCTRCDLIWLDFGEIQQIVDAPGRDRGTRGAGPSVREPAPDGDVAEAQAERKDPLTALLGLLRRG
jgi:Zn-finger nucleic acid-binding protein